MHAGGGTTAKSQDDSETAPGACSLSLPVLVLNRIFQPVRIVNARRALVMLYRGTANALSNGGELLDFAGWMSLPVRPGLDDGVATLRGALRVPRIVHLCRYARLRRPTLRLSRRNILLRDGHRCQYCGTRGSARELDMDHVQPRSRGGRDSWQNLVTSCQPCNRRKGRRTPAEANMPLLKRPTAPRWSHSTQLLSGAARRYREWEPFLGEAGTFHGQKSDERQAAQ